MSLVGNPFRPGAGRVPPELAGRRALADEFVGMLYEARQTGEGQRPWIVSGLRGVGKTVLLNSLAREAIDLGSLVVKVEATPTQSLSLALSKQLNLILRRMLAREMARHLWIRAARVLKSFQLRIDPSGAYSFGIDLDPERGVADSGDLSVDLQELLEAVGEAARSEGMAVLLAVDELQDAGADELTALNIALHNLGQSTFPPPVLFLGAGLPSLPGVLAEATSYAERLYDYRRIGLLDEDSTRQALTGPTDAAGVLWDPAALDQVVKATGGYPYFIQACGSHVWAARSGERISVDDARIGVVLAREELDQGLYRSRWERATPAQQRVMHAMARDRGRPSSIADLVARTSRKRASDLSVVRRELIRNGHVYSPDRGLLAFTVPGMDEFIRAEDD